MGDGKGNKTNSFAPLIAGVCGGGVSTTLLLPLDNIKVRLQVNEDPHTFSRSKSKRLGTNRFDTIRLLRGVVRHEGVIGLYQGLSPALVGSVVSWGGYFFFYEGFKERLKVHRALPKSQSLSSLDNFLLACSAGAVMVLMTNPLWLIKLRMQLQMKRASEQLNTKVQPYDGMFDAARTIVRDEGFWALYKGSGPALLLTTHGGVQFVVYEFLRKNFHNVRTKKDSGDSSKSIRQRLENSLGYLMMGAASKIIASTTTYPLQVVKSRMQQRSELVELTAEGDVRVVKREYAGLIQTTQRMYTKEGVSGFFKGCIPNAIRVAPSAAITFVVYEAVRDFLAP